MAKTRKIRYKHIKMFCRIGYWLLRLLINFTGVTCPPIDCPVRPYIPEGQCCPICPDDGQEETPEETPVQTVRPPPAPRPTPGRPPAPGPPPRKPTTSKPPPDVSMSRLHMGFQDFMKHYGVVFNLYDIFNYLLFLTPSIFITSS